MKYFISSLILLLLFISCEDTLVQNNPYDPDSNNSIIGSVSGIVSPYNSNASIIALKGNTIVVEQKINSDGSFKLEYLPEGDYALIVVASNFLTDSTLNEIIVEKKKDINIGTIYLNSALLGTIAGKVEPNLPNTSITLSKSGNIIDTGVPNSNGEFSFTNLEPGTYLIKISLSGYSDYTNDQVTVTKGITTNLGTIILNDVSKGSITGFITPKSSAAIVSLFQANQVLDSISINPLTGQYLFKNLNPGNYDVTINAEGFAKAYIKNIAVIAGNTNEGNSYNLERTGEIRGSVFPINSNAFITAMVNNNIITSTLINQTNGSYTISGLSPGTYDIIISADNKITDESLKQITVYPANSTIVDRVYLAGIGSNALYGKVVNQQNNLIVAGAKLNNGVQEVISDEQGYFCFYSLTAGSNNINVSKEGYLTSITTVNIPSVGSLKSDITIIGAGSMFGTVRDNQNNSLIPNARISVNNDDFVAYTNSSGYYFLESLPSGQTQIYVSKQGYNSSNFQKTVIPQQSTEANFTLTSLNANTGALQGTVKSSTTNQPINGVSVIVDGYYGLTNSLGVYVIENIPAGSHSVKFENTSYITKTVTTNINVNQTSTLDVQLSPKFNNNLPTGTVTCTIRDYYTHNVINLTGRVYAWLAYNFQSNEPFYYADSAYDGVLKIRNLDYQSGGNTNYNTFNIPIGVYRLWTTDYYISNLGSTGYTSFDIEVNVVQGVNNIDVFVKQLSSIGGVVKDFNGNPIPDVNILGIKTDNNGVYFKNKINPDIEEITFQKDGYYSKILNVDLIPGNHELINETLIELPRVTGVVTDINTGNKLADVEITSSNAETTYSDQNGNYSTTFYSSGTRTVNFVKPGYQNYAVTLNVPTTGYISLNVQLTPQ